MKDPRRNFRPEPEMGVLGEFKLLDEADIRAILRRLREDGCPVGLFIDSPSFVTSRVLEVERDHLDLEIGVDDGFSTGTRGWQRVFSAPVVLCVAFVDGVKVQFEGRGARVEVRGEERLRIALPKQLYRLQRREGYRVRPLNDEPVSCILKMPDGSRQIPVLDLSVVGVALHFPKGYEPPAVGTILRDVRLRTSEPRLLPCVLAVRRVMPYPGEGYQVGCSYEFLSPETSRAIGLLVREVEVARRHR